MITGTGTAIGTGRPQARAVRRILSGTFAPKAERTISGVSAEACQWKAMLSPTKAAILGGSVDAVPGTSLLRGTLDGVISAGFVALPPTAFTMVGTLHLDGNHMKNEGRGVAVRVLLADDHPALRAGFATSLPAFGVEVVGEVGRASDVIARFKEIKPDVLVLDIRFGDEMSGLEIAEDLLKMVPSAKIVFLSQFNQNSIVKRAYQIGGKGFITKDCEVCDLAVAIKKVTSGEVYFMPKVAERLASMAITSDPHSPEDVLADRELKVFKLMAQGLTIVEIAEKLDLSVKTISNTSQTVKEKLNLHRPADITLLAVRYGLVQPERL